MAFDIDNISGSLGLSNIKGEIYDISIYIIWGLIILGVGLFLWKKYKDKKVYIYPVRIYKQRNNGLVKEFNTFGGYIKKGNVTQFIIKMSRFKKRPTDKLPLSEYMDEDDRIYYWQISPESPLIQVKRDFFVEEVLVSNDNFIEPTKEDKEFTIKKMISNMLNKEEYKDKSKEDIRIIAENLFDEDISKERNKLMDITRPIYTPVPTNLKQQAIAEINLYKNTLGVDVNKQFAYFIMGVIALVILGTVIFYIAVNKGGIPILTDSILSLVRLII